MHSILRSTDITWTLKASKCLIKLRKIHLEFDISDFWVFPKRSSSQLSSFLCLPQDRARPVLEDLLGLTLLIRQAYGKCCSTIQTAEAVRPIRYENSSYLIISACSLLHKQNPEIILISINHWNLRMEKWSKWKILERGPQVGIKISTNGGSACVSYSGELLFF